MADHLDIQVGRPPWQPSGGSTHLVKVLNRYSIPLMGIVEQHGTPYVFWCFDGHANAVNYWAYQLLTEAESERLQKASRSELPRAMREITSRGAQAVLAVARDDRIVTSTRTDAGHSFGASPDERDDALAALHQAVG